MISCQLSVEEAESRWTGGREAEIQSRGSNLRASTTVETAPISSFMILFSFKREQCHATFPGVDCHQRATLEIVPRLKNGGTNAFAHGCGSDINRTELDYAGASGGA